MSITTITNATNVLEGLVRGLSSGGSIPEFQLPHISELPKPPNRLTNYSTFSVDSLIFIDALLPFIDDVNLNNLLVSMIKPNKWNMGNIVETNIFPVFTPYIGNPDSQVKPSVGYVSAIDNEYLYLKNYSTIVNSIMLWIHGVQIERGTVDIWNLPSVNIKPLTPPMTRNMGETEFNSKSVSLSQSTREYTASILQVKQQYDGWLNTILDMGYITEDVTDTFDMGYIEDTVISN